MSEPGTSDRKQGRRARRDPAGRPPGNGAAFTEATFSAVFDAAPDAYLLLAPDPPSFTMVAANEARLRATMTRREDVIGRPLFEVFPDNPDDPEATGVSNLRASLEEVMRTGRPHRMALQKYDIRTPDGRFEDRYWDPLNSPVFDEDGELIYIIHRVEDVTEQVRGRGRLRTLESVVTAANDAVIVTEPEPVEQLGGRPIIFVNDAFTRMTGYAAGEVVGRSARMLQGPDTDAGTLRRIGDALERREPVRAELLNYRKDGSPFWVEISISPVLDEQGRVVQWTSVQRETTERRKALETALQLARETTAREQEERARREIEQLHSAEREAHAQVATILESITDAFFAVDREWRFTYVNREAERLLQRTRDDLLGRNLWQEFGAALGTTFQREYERAMNEQTTVRFEAYYPPPLDAWYDVRGYPTADGLSVYFSDITSRKQAEERLRESEERYRLLADMIPQYIWATDPDGYHTYFSRRWYEFTGMTLESSQGEGWAEKLHPDDRERTSARWQHSLRTGEPYSIEYRFLGANGEYRWFWGQAEAQRNEAGEIVAWWGTLTDVTERRELEAERERLLASEQALREQVTSILESITDAFFAVDADWRFTYVNREAERLLHRSRAQLLGRSLWDEYPGAVGTATEREYRRAVADQVTVAFEQNSAALGIWVDVRAYPADGGLAVFFRDVTDRKRAEEHLRESEERFRALAENANVAIFVMDADSVIEFANPAVERIFGFTVDELLGRQIDVLMPPDQRARHHVGVRRYLETGERRVPWEAVELPGLTKDGRVVPLEISMGEFERAGRHYFTGIARDISERKRAEEAMRESEERFRTLGNSIPQLAWMADESGSIFWYNERWYEYTGSTFDEMQGWGWRSVHHPEHVERVVARIRHSFETGEPWEDTFPLRRRDGVYRWFLSRALPIHDAEGRIVRWFGTNTDITHEIEAASERERLLAREQDARAEAERRREEVQRVTESRERLMRGFSHDVKNPLGAADGYAQLLEEGIYGELTEKQTESIRRIRRSIDTALHLIHDLLELARAETGQLDIERIDTDVTQAACEVADDFRAQADAAGLKLRCEVPDGLHAETDPTRVRQILANLLSNAVKYAPNAQASVTARVVASDTGAGRVPRIALSVADTGPGIPAEKREAIFEEFTRLDPQAQTGAGVGLAISRRIAQLMGGDLTVESEVGRGSTFTLWLPVTTSLYGSDGTSAPGAGPR
ncbi:MAG TPA: PAS domain S-box protein [Longimicrobiales bacterium]